jgi:potassium channel subfamily K
MLPTSKSILSHSVENDTKNYRFSEKEILVFSCCAVFITYFAFGVYTMVYIEDLSILDGFYFLVVTLTTTGYGDILPKHNSSKLFVSFYIFFGLGLVVSAIGWIWAWVNIKQEQLRLVIASKFVQEENEYGEENDSSSEVKGMSPSISPLLSDAIKDVIIATCIIIGTVLFGALFYTTIVDSYSLVDGIYLSAVTIGTVGYGDLTPTNNSSKIFTVLYCFFGSLICASALAMYNNAVFCYMTQKNIENEISNRTLSLGDILLMDRDNDRSVTREEFILYKLKRLNIIDDKLCKQIDDQFTLLDKDHTNTLTADDIDAFHSSCIQKRNQKKANNKIILSKVRGGVNRIGPALNASQAVNDNIKLNELTSPSPV